jgi:hypothetical protein
VKTKYDLRPASPEEAGLFYAADHETDLTNGCIGHVRMDFGSGESFWHTWWPRGPEEWNSPEFKQELGEVVDEMRQGVLKNLRSMGSYCCNHGGELPSGGYGRSIYGYVTETDHYRYCLRCLPYKGDYNAYLTCYDKQVQEMNQAQQTAAPTMTIGGMT